MNFLRNSWFPAVNGFLKHEEHEEKQETAEFS